MEDSRDLFDYMIANEKKQKYVTLITVFLFLGFAIAIVVMIFNNRKLSEKLQIQERKTDSLYQVRRQDSVTAKDNIVLMEATRDSLVSALEKVRKSEQNNLKNNRPVYFPNNSVAEKGQLITFREITNVIEKATDEKMVVYIQYSKGNLNEAQRVAQRLKERGFVVKKLQNMGGMNFKSNVRYFDQEKDARKADEIAGIAKEASGKSYDAAYFNLKSPANQIEVWVGN